MFEQLQTNGAATAAATDVVGSAEAVACAPSTSMALPTATQLTQLSFMYVVWHI